MATTTNYGWSTPDNTALVKDGASAIRTLGSSVDTSLKSLSPGTTAGDVDYYTSSTAKARLGIGTTGQVLTVAGGVPSWASPSDQTPLTTKGDLFTFTTTDARLGVGTDGQVLTAASGQPTGLQWSTPVAGGMTLISTTTLSGASVTLSSIPQTYKSLVMYVRNYLPATNGQLLRFRYNSDAGANRYGTNDLGVSTSGTYNGTSMYAQIEQNSTTGQGFSYIPIYDYTNTTTWKYANVMCVSNSSTTATTPMLGSYWAIYNQTTAISSITLFANSGNLTSGTVLLYGVA